VLPIEVRSASTSREPITPRVGSRSGDGQQLRNLQNLQPGTSIKKWLFLLDDSKSLYGKWLEIPKDPLKIGCLGFQKV